jgi:2-methylisocitrate lyase-like PEP mutase family enzyme
MIYGTCAKGRAAAREVGCVPMTRTQQEKGAAFAALHAGEPFVIPNPWDAGSARVLAALGFKALASTSSGFAFTLGRAENHIRGNPDLADTIARLQAYEHAGADVLYAPGLRSTQEIRAVCEAVSKPVNVLAVPGLSFTDITQAGAQRVSVGGALAWAAVMAMAQAATAIRDDGDFTALSARPPLGDWFPS